MKKALALIALCAVSLAGCTQSGSNGSDSPTPTGSSSSPSGPPSGAINVVTTTSVWASIIEFVGGDAVNVTAIISDPNRDPHSYEASARDQLAVSEAELVVINGGGYDDFMNQLLEADETPAKTLFVVDSEPEHAHEGGDEGHSHEENEHVWYDFETVSNFSVNLSDALVELRPEVLEQVSSNFDVFQEALDVLILRRDSLRDDALGLGAMQTAPLAQLLLDDAGFVDLTPPELLSAIEEEREVPALVMADAEALIRGGEVRLLVVNRQLLDSQTEQLLTWAEAAGVHVVELSELIPDPSTQDYLDWMGEVMDLLQQAIWEL